MQIVANANNNTYGHILSQNCSKVDFSTLLLNLAGSTLEVEREKLLNRT